MPPCAPLRLRSVADRASRPRHPPRRAPARGRIEYRVCCGGRSAIIRGGSGSGSRPCGDDRPRPQSGVALELELANVEGRARKRPGRGHERVAHGAGMRHRVEGANWHGFGGDDGQSLGEHWGFGGSGRCKRG
jgi:hypothetical protein